MERWKRQAKSRGLSFAEYLRALLDGDLAPHASVSEPVKAISLPQAPERVWKGPDFKEKKKR